MAEFAFAESFRNKSGGFDGTKRCIPKNDPFVKPDACFKFHRPNERTQAFEQEDDVCIFFILQKSAVDVRAERAPRKGGMWFHYLETRP